MQTERFDGMQITGADEAPENGHVAPVSLRTVHVLPDHSEIRVDVTKPAGVPVESFRLILDAYSRRTRNRFSRIGWKEADDSILLRRLAEGRAPQREPDTDPLFWLVRTRWEIRAATLSHAALQPGARVPPTRYLPPRS